MEKSKSKPTEIKEILVLGFGGHGREIASFIKQMSEASLPVKLFGFADDDLAKKDKVSSGARVLGSLDELRGILSSRSQPLHYITAFGDNKIRFKVAERARALGGKLLPWTLLHPRAFLGESLTIGEGTALFPGSVLTTQVTLGAHCIVNTQASISHDAVIGDFTNINPGVRICGNVTVGANCYIGAGATVIDKITIGAGTVIGAGATVTKSLPEKVLAVGTPARIIKNL